MSLPALCKGLSAGAGARSRPVLPISKRDAGGIGSQHAHAVDGGGGI
jgi:hypothetical protein